MLLKSQQKLLTKLINLPEIVVIDFNFVEEVGLIFSVKTEQKIQNCPKCFYQVHSLHQNHHRLIKDLSLFNQIVYLNLNQRQLKCNQCGNIFSERLNFIDKNKIYTRRLALKAYQEYLESDLFQVAERNNLSQEEIKNILKKMRTKDTQKCTTEESSSFSASPSHIG